VTPEKQLRRGGDQPRHAYVMFHNYPRASLIALILPVGAIVIMLLLAFHSTADAVQRVDEAVLREMIRIRLRPLTWVALGLNIVGSSFVTLPVRIAACIWLSIKRKWWFLATFLSAVVASEVVSTVLKHLYDRPRPPHPLVHTTGASFPSGHAVATAVTAVALVIVLFPPGSERRKWEVWAIVLTLIMGISRAYLGAHWLSDAVAGVLIGASLALCSALVVQGIHDRRTARALELAAVRPQEGAESIPPPGPLDTSAIDDEG
jgi:membrane-associated phospholipid phosphatase